MPTTVRIPMALSTVQPDTGNAFFAVATGANLDLGYVVHVDSGESISTWWTIVPTNVAATPAWNVDVYHHVATSGGGNVMFTTRALAVANAEVLDVAATVVSSAATFAVAIATTMTVSAVSGGTFDTVVGVAANDLLLVEVNRHGGNASDTLGLNWNVNAVVLKIDVT